MAFSRFGDERFARGFARLVDSGGFAMLMPGDESRMASNLELSRRPAAPAAIKLINVLKNAKAKAFDEGHAKQNGRATEISKKSHLAEIYRKVSAKIAADAELDAIFVELEKRGLYAHPCRVSL